MSLLLFPVFKPKLRLQPETTGEFIGANLGELEDIAEEVGPDPLSTFGDNRDVPEDFDGDISELDEVLGEWDEWFDPIEGASAVDRLIGAIGEDSTLRTRLEVTDEVIRELNDLATQLRAAREQGCKFRLELSY